MIGRFSYESYGRDTGTTGIAALSGNAYKWLMGCKEPFRRVVINDVFKDYFKHMSLSCDPKSGVLPVVVDSSSHNEFDIMVGSQKLLVSISGENNIKRLDNGIVCLYLNAIRPDIEIEGRIKHIEIDKNTKRRRSNLSDMYTELCIWNGILPDIQYPAGSEVWYKEHIRGLSAKKIHWSV